MEPIAYTLETTKETAPTVFINDKNGKKVYLHSAFYPTRDADSLRADLSIGTADLLIVLGVGLGYHLIPLVERRGAFPRVILVERLQGIAQQLENISSVSFLAGSPGITLLSGCDPDEVSGRLETVIDFDSIASLRVLEHPASIRAFGDYYAAVRAGIERLIAKKAGDAAARKAFGYRYLKNALVNLGSIARLRPVSALFGLCPGLPAAVVMPGPSLEASLQYLGRHRDRLVLIAVDSALPALRASGIDPDIFVSIDPQAYTWEHAAGLHDSSAMAAYSLTANPRLPHARDGFLSLNSHPMAQLVEQLVPGLVGSIDSATGSVAGDAINLARLCGFGPIGIVGFDSCFDAFRIYARGTSYQDRYARFFQTRLNPVETQNMRYIMTASRGYRAEGRFTRKSFVAYNNTLARFIAKNDIPRLVHVNPNGLPLAGVPGGTLDQVLSGAGEGASNARMLLRERIAAAPVLGDILDLSEIHRALAIPENRDAVLRASLDEKTLVKRDAAITQLIERLMGGGR